MRLEEPKIEFVEIDPTDVITASGGCPDVAVQSVPGATECVLMASSKNKDECWEEAASRPL